MKKKLRVFCSLLLALQLVLSMVAVPVFAEGDESTKYTAPESPAVTYNMNVDWKFKKATSDALALKEASEALKDSEGKQFYEVGYNDNDWETVSVPHPINAADSFDGTIANSGEGGIYRRFMFYRKHITVPTSDEGKKFFIEFEAVRNSVYLYVNGQMAGYYEAGVVSTGYDITEYIIPGQDNVIAVATDNASTRGRTNFTTTETINDGQHTPGDLSGSGYEWNTNEFNETQGGITGNVNLYAKSQIYQTLPLYNNLKTTGNYIYASDFDLRDVNNSKATINVKAEIRNETNADKELTLQVDVVKMDGTLAASFTQNGTAVKAEDTDEHFMSIVPADAYDENPAATNAETVDVSYITASLAMENLRLWSPADPYIYTVYTILKDGDNVIDVQEKATGFREVIYDYNGNDGGFKINGKPAYLKGYAQRSTNEWAAIGVANDWLTDYDMSLVRESNSNFIRWMHVAPKPAAIRSTDKYGIVSVCPAGDKEKDVEGRQWDQRMEAMRDAIIYYRNSPSVIFWEAGNGDISAEHMQEMTDIKKLLDPNGFRFMGCRTISSVEQVRAAEYIGTMLFRNAGPAQNSMKEIGKYIPIMETEYSRGESPRRVWDDFSPYFAPNYQGETLYDYVNKYTTGAEGASTDGLDTWDLTQEDFIRRNIADYTDFYNGRVGGPGSSYTDSKGNSYNVNQYVAAALMIWADSNQHGRMTVSENCRTSGKVDAARIKKESFYALQTAQSDEPSVHIVGHWNYPEKTEDNYWYYEQKDNGAGYYENGEKRQRDPSAKTVYVIGSGSVRKVELYINDNLIDTCTKPTSNYIYSFPNVDVTQSGKISVKAYNAQDEVIANDEITTAGEASKIRLTPVTGPKGFLADGSDIMYFDVEVVDEKGNVCPLSYDKINLKLSGNGVLMGGYNSGADANKYTQESEQSIYAECGVNRVFVRSTRNAGQITLSASLEGQAPTEATVTSTAVEVTDGLALYKQQSLAADEKPPVIQQTVPEIKPLAKAFTADFGENGNTEVVKDEEVQKDIYEVKVNDTTVEFTDEAYNAGDAIWVEALPVLEALKTAGAPITSYSYDESTKTLTVNGEDIEIKAIVDNTFIMVTKNGVTDEVGPMNGAPLISDSGIFVMDMSTLFTQLGITTSTDSETKVYSITYTAPSAQTSVNNINLFNDDNTDPDKCVKITATYDDNGVLTDVTTEIVSKSEAFPVSEKNRKVMYWESLESMVPVTAEVPDASPVPWGPQDITKYDTLVSKHECEESELASLTGNNGGGNAQVPVTIENGAPDGTKYIKTGAVGNNKYDEYCFEKEFSFGGNTKSDVMFALDVRFDAEGSGFCAESDSDSKLAGAVKNNGGKLAVQKGSKDYNTTSVVIDTNTWYHIAMVGRYSAADAMVDMYVWKYKDDGTKEYITKVDNIALRNLSASNNNGASHLNVLPNTSVDNLSVYKLGADSLSINSSDNVIKAGETMLFTYGATRGNAHITSPEVKWAIYNADNTEALADDQITISDSGLLVIGANAQSQIISVRVIANEGTENEIYAAKKIKVESVDTSSDTYDALTLSSDKTTVRVGENVQISAEATLNGEAVTPGDGDLKYVICNEANLRELGNKGITITDDGVLSVTADVIPQTITVKGVNKSGSISGACQIQVLPANLNYGNEDLYSDTFASSNACEEYGLTGLSLEEGSWDGSGYYNVTAGTDFAGFDSNTTADVIYSADMKFANDGAGWTIYNASKGKLGLQLSLSGTTLNAIGASNKTVGSLTGIDKNAWYNVQIMCATGKAGDSYAVCTVYKYDENGNKVHPTSGEANKAYNLTVDLRNLSESSANHININAGTHVDNVLNMFIAPDELKIAVDAKEVLAGGSAQATTTASRKGVAFPKLNSNLIKYEIYDSENKYPLESDKITISPLGKITVDAMAEPQDVYVRVSSTSGGMSDSVKLTIKSSDIFEITKAGFNEDFSSLKRLTVTKNFYYNDDVTFVAATYDEDGVMTSIATKKMFGDSLNIGEGNQVTMNMTMPAAFDKVSGSMNAFVVTKLSTSKKTEGADITITPGTTTTVLSNLPEFDASAKVVVLVLKSGANEESVTDADIAYFTQMSAADIADNSITIPGVMANGMTAKVVGTVGGVHTIAASMLGTIE